MSVISVTSRRTLGSAASSYSTVMSIGGFLAVSAFLFAFGFQEAEGGRSSLIAVWTASVAPVLPALAAFLAMDVWSEDLRTGRVDLLLSAAVRERDLVLGKWLGVLILMAGTVTLSLTLSLGTLAVFAPAALKGVSVFSFVPGLLALILQGSLWAAVSVAVSALTRHGAVAACASVGVLIAVPRALWAGLMAWSPAGRTAYGEMPLDAHAIDIATGAFSTGAVVSYVVLACTALFMASRFVASRRLVGRGARRQRASTYVAIGLSVAFSVLAILMAFRLDRTWDIPVGATAMRFSPRMRTTLSELNGDLTVTSFVSRKDPRFRPIAHFLRGLKREADSMGGVRLDVRFVDPRWDLGAAERLIRAGATEDCLVFEKARRMAVIPLKDGYDESICVSAIRRVALPPQRRSVYWSTGHGESAFEAYDAFGMSDIARELAREGYANFRLDLTGDAQVPVDCALVIVAGAKEDFSRVELGRIDAYLKRGGRLLVLLSSEQGGVSSLLPSWGMRSMTHALDGARTLSGSDVIVTEFTEHVISAPLKGAQIVLERPLAFVPSAATEGGAGADRLEYSSVAKVGAVAVSAAVERGAGAGADLAIRPTRIIAVGDASFVMNGPLAARANANRDFFMNCVAYLSGTDAMAASGTETAVLTSGMDRVARVHFAIVFGGALPLSVMLVLFVMVFRRRRRLS